MSHSNPGESSPIPTEPRNLAERLKWLRKRKGFTQVELSAALGCEQGVVSSWEVGRTHPTSVTLKTIAQFYGIPPETLDSGNGFMREAERALAPRGEERTAPMANTRTLALPTTTPGALLVIDLNSDSQETLDHAEGVAALLKAVSRGRKAWILLE